MSSNSASTNLSFAQRGRLKSLWAIVFFAVLIGLMGPAGKIADQAILRWHYGFNTVNRQALRIVGYNPKLKVSNGDLLSAGAGFSRLLIFAAIVITAGGLILASLKRTLPQACRDALDKPRDIAYEGPTVSGWSAVLIITIGLFTLQAKMPWLACAASAAVLLVTLAGIRRRFAAEAASSR